MNMDHHPCFNPGAHHHFGRVHLPVAPRCNIQCKYCNRKFDCINESRPGVTSAVLTPHQALVYLDTIMEKKPNIAVVGIAGPGDPMANPDETLATLRGVRERYPDMLLCLATNGLNLSPYIGELAGIGLSHITVTVNAVDPEIGEKLYSWVRYDRRVYRAGAGVRVLMERQQAAVAEAKARGITVKINFITIPGVNDHYVEAVARRMKDLKADLFNCVPYRPAPDTAFADIAEPAPEQMAAIRETAGRFLPQMRHCTRCRADAVGLLGEAPDPELMKTLQSCATLTENVMHAPKSNRPNIAVASVEGMLVNQHLGEAEKLLIYGEKAGRITFLEARNTPEKGTGGQRWQRLADTLSDCGTLLVSGIGENPKQALSDAGITVLEINGMIDEAVAAVIHGESIRHLAVREMRPCRCAGMGVGCS